MVQPEFHAACRHVAQRQACSTARARRPERVLLQVECAVLPSDHVLACRVRDSYAALGSACSVKENPLCSVTVQVLSKGGTGARVHGAEGTFYVYVDRERDSDTTEHSTDQIQ